MARGELDLAKYIATYSNVFNILIVETVGLPVTDDACAAQKNNHITLFFN